MARKRQKLGEILKSWGKVTDKQIVESVKVAQGAHKRLGETLVELGHTEDADLARAIAYQQDMEYIDLDQQGVVARDNMKLLPTDIIRKYSVLPLGQINGKLKIAVHDPLDLGLMDDIRFRLDSDFEIAIGARSKIKHHIDELLSEGRASIDEAVKQMSVDLRAESIDLRAKSMDLINSIDVARLNAVGESSPEDADNQAPIIRLVHQVITEAVNNRASDIHIEPFENRVRLRYRIDGVCHARDTIPKRTQNNVTARLKIMAGMKIQEKRIPQDGRIKMKVGNRLIDFRVSSCPTYHGESVVLRILRPESARIGLRNLGMREDTLQAFNNIISRPNGIFLVTGPTGSGKTTTLYTALDILNRPDKKIITAEDPVEYNFKGVNQCQVNEQIGLTFSRILRAMLRQAPNIVLVGEIRDQEVGDVAIQAALTGHLVFSTLHTNDAPSAITRLIDMGIKPFLVASSIQAVLAQRLVRIICEHCREPDTNPNPRLLALCGLTEEDLQTKTIYKAAGCSRCAKTGYHGREGIYELMIISSLPLDWNIPEWASEKLIRSGIGEGIPPILVKSI